MTSLRFLAPFVAIISLFSMNKRIAGEYVDSLGDKIIIENSFLTYIRHNGPFDYDTLAICTLKHVRKQFYLISSNLPDLLRSSRSVELLKEENLDSLYFNLVIPFSHSDLLIYVSITDVESSDLLAKGEFIFPDKKTISLPKIDKTVLFNLSVSPLYSKDYDLFNIHWSNYLGILHFWDSFIVPVDFNHIVYSNQSIDDMVFKNFNIQDEYIMINGSSIIWRNTVYKKRKRLNSDSL